MYVVMMFVCSFFVTSINAQSQSGSGKVAYDTLTDGGKNYPSSYEVTNEISTSLSGPTGECTEAKPPKAVIVVESENELCNYPDLGAKWIKNCDNLYNQGIPKDALEYTLKAFRQNATKFTNNKCYIFSERADGGSHADFKKAMAKGIPNKCQIVINNINEKAPKGYEAPYRRKMYYIDICKGKVTTTYFNLGTGTFKGKNTGKKFKNTNGERSTVKGVFLTGQKVFNFQPTGSTSVPKYKAIRKRLKVKSGEHKAHALQLFGLQKSNNGSGVDGKHMHVSPYQSSWGCPSVKEDNYWMINELGKNGPSLVVNYGDGMQDIDEVNDCGSRKK